MSDDIAASGGEPTEAQDGAGETPDGGFTAEYVKELREEAKARRLELEPFKESFGALSKADQQWMLDLAKGFASDPVAAAERMSEAANQVMKIYGADPQSSAEPTTNTDVNVDEEPLELTKSQLDAMLAKIREDVTNEFQSTRAQDQVNATLQKLGYEAESIDATLLFGFAEQTGGDLEAAHQKVLEYKKAEAQKLIEEEKEANTLFPRMPQTATITPAPNTTPPKSISEASAAAKEFLRSAAKNALS